MSKRLLLVEDETKLRDQLLEILGRHQYEVESCTDGMEGLYLAQKYDYDIAIIDLGLPKVPGIEIVEKISTFLTANFWISFSQSSDEMIPLEIHGYRFGLADVHKIGATIFHYF